MNYPETKTQPCAFCGTVMSLSRHGDGTPWRGRKNYWYTSDHICESETAKAIRNNHVAAPFRAILNSFGGAK